MPFDHQSIVRKIKKMLERAEGERAVGNAETAAQYIEMAHAALRRHKLDLSVIDLAAQDTENPIGHDTFVPKEHDIPMQNHNFEWQQFLAVTVAEAHYCCALGWSEMNIITFAGREAERQICVYLYVFMLRTAMKLADDEWERYHGTRLWWMKKSDLMYLPEKETYQNSFLFGFAQTVQKRYLERGQLRDPVPAAPESSTALARINDDFRRAQEYTLQLSSGRQSKVEPKGHLQIDAFRQGIEHGQQVRIDANVIGQEGNGPDEIEN